MCVFDPRLGAVVGRKDRGASLHTRAFEVEERRSAVGPDRVWVRWLHQVPSGAGVSDRGLVVILPGPGLPGYTLPTAAAVAARGVECAVLGLQSKRTTSPWSWRVRRSRPSTGAWRGCSRPAPLAYRKDRLREIDVKEVLRARGDLVRMVLERPLGDTPESRVAGLAAPLTVTAGIADAYAPVVWLDLLARSAVRAAGTRTSLLGGSHNNLYTHPHEMAGLVVLALDDAPSLGLNERPSAPVRSRWGPG